MGREDWGLCGDRGHALRRLRTWPAHRQGGRQSFAFAGSGVDDVPRADRAWLLAASSALGTHRAALPAALFCRTGLHTWVAVGNARRAAGASSVDCRRVPAGISRAALGNGMGGWRLGRARRSTAAQALAGAVAGCHLLRGV